MPDLRRLVLVVVLAIAGCEGDPGVPGVPRLPSDLYPPSAEIILPLASRPLAEHAIIETRVADDDSVARIAFLVDGAPPAAGTILPLAAPSQYSWDCRGLSLGQHSLQLMAWDRRDKLGQSALLYLNRSDLVVGGIDTLILADDDTTKSIKYKVPADSLSDVRALATRFSPDRPVVVQRAFVRVFRKDEWNGRYLTVDLMSVRNGLPDTVIYSADIGFRSVGYYNGWASIGMGSTPIDGEFIIAVHQSDKSLVDTLGIQTDDGLWKNGHGLVMNKQGNWREFTSGSGKQYNPLIYVTVGYR